MAGCHVTTSLCVAAMARGAARCNSDVYVSCDSAPAIFLQISASSAEHSRDCKHAYASKRVFSEFLVELTERLAVSSHLRTRPPIVRAATPPTCLRASDQ